MTINPRPDQEMAIQEAIRAGLIRTEIDALDIGLESLREQLIGKFSKEIDLHGRKRNSFPDIFSSIKGDDLDLRRTPQEAAAHIREIRKGNSLPNGVTIRDLINEGRA